MKVVYYKPEYYDKLLEFSLKIWPEKSVEYMNYRLFNLPEDEADNSFNIMVLNEQDEIVGCTLYMPTRARIGGKDIKVFWGHDMYIEENYRGAASILMISEQLNLKESFGFGATDINLKIQKELGTKFIGKAYHCLVFNINAVKLLLFRFNLINKPIKKNLFFPDHITVREHTFTRVNSIEEMNIPEGGYWCDSSIDVEFVRDRHFLKERFFDNFIDYTVYKLRNNDSSEKDECYFVLRPVMESGIPVLSLVDFRTNLKKPGQLKMIIKAGHAVARSNKFPVLTLRTSVKLKKFQLYPCIYRASSKQHVSTHLDVGDDPELLVTIADSDTDFLYDY